MCYVTLMSSVYTIIYSNFAASMPVLLPCFLYLSQASHKHVTAYIQQCTSGTDKLKKGNKSTMPCEIINIEMCPRLQGLRESSILVCLQLANNKTPLVL